MFWYATALSAAAGPGFSLFAIIFPIAHVAVGIGLTYWTICAFFNTTLITLNLNRLTVRHGPVPWRGNAHLDPAGVIGVRIARNGHNNEEPRYKVTFKTDKGQDHQILGWLERDRARYLRDWLRYELAIR
ncbi:MAG: hypothetical protein RIG82_10460 [Phycisphaeraceae bacterium]